MSGFAGSRVVSVNVRRPQPAAWEKELGRTAIDKRPVEDEVAVRALGLAGDEVADPRYHGGTYQAVYAYAREDLDFWSEQLGRALDPGQFGENLTTAGLDVNAAVLGETWRVGTALLQVVDVRIPCNTFKGWLGDQGFDNTSWVRRFTAAGRPGPYLRVLEEGYLRAGDALTVESRPEHGVTVRTMFEAFTTNRSRLPELLTVEGLKPEVHQRADEYLAGRSR